MRRRGERTLELVLSIPQRRGFADCPAFFHAMAGVLRASSIFAGRAPATVTSRVRPFCASYEICLPSVEHQVLNEDERKLRRTLFDHWQRQLRGLRGDMLELRQREIQALELRTFATLSAALARTLSARELAAMPTAAAAAIRETLACGRVVISKLTQSPKTRVVLAAVGVATGKLLSFEAEAGRKPADRFGRCRAELDGRQRAGAPDAVARAGLRWRAPSAPQPAAIGQSRGRTARAVGLALGFDLTPSTSRLVDDSGREQQRHCRATGVRRGHR